MLNKEDKIGIAAKIATDHIQNTEEVFECFREAGLKLTIENLVPRAIQNVNVFEKNRGTLHGIS